MKQQMITLLAATIITASCNSQDIAASQVPSVVLNTLKTKYPAAKDVDWEKHNGYYEAELDINDSTDVTVHIDEAGKLIMWKQEIPVQELPAGVLAAVQSQYKDYRIDDVDQIEKDGTVYYQVELDRQWKRDLKRVYTAEGKDEKTIAYWD